MSKKPKFYKQYDKKWADTKWSKTTLKKYGSGPTCIANAVSVFTGLEYINITPAETFTWICESGNMVDRSGTRWAGITAGLKHYGVEKVIETSNSSEVKKALKNNDWVIAVVKESRWAKKGHYILIYKLTDDNHVLVSDSASSSDSRQKNGTWNELVNAGVHYWIIDDTLGYDPDDTSIEEFEDPYAVDSDFGDNGVYVDFEKLKPNILVIDRDIEPKKFKPKDWKKNGVIGVMLEAGYYYNSNHKVVERFRNPILYDQVNKLIRAKLPYGYFFRARGKNEKEVSKEMYEFSFIVRKYPPAFGVWLYPDFMVHGTSRSVIYANDILFKEYETELVRLGLKGKIGIRCKRGDLKEFSWDKLQNSWWLWLNDHVSNLDDLEQLLDPEFFDIDNKSGELPEEAYTGNNTTSSSKGDRSSFNVKDNINLGKTSGTADAAATWAEKICDNNKFAYGVAGGTWYHGRDRAHQLGCHFCGTTVHGPKRAKKGDKWDYTYCCNAFATAAYVHGGKIRKECWKSGLSIRSWTAKGFRVVGRNLGVNKLKRGDLVLCVNRHIAIYIGKNKTAEAAGEGWGSSSVGYRNFTSKYYKKRSYVILRYVEKKKK